MSAVTVTTHPNIALIKYWGKRDENLFLPTKSSLSIGLAALTTQTSLDISPTGTDAIILNGTPATPAQAQPMVTFLKHIRTTQAIDALSITTTNSFPTAAGLASSASGFAALTLGLNKLFNLNLSDQQLSIFARQGSGSASRSLFGGFVVWHRGYQSDGTDSIAEQLFTDKHWPNFRTIVVIVTKEAKKISSRAAMQQSVATSPIYEKWVEASERRLTRMHKAITDKNFNEVGQLAEEDCLGMHKTMHTSQPQINFLSPTTCVIMQLVTDLRTKLGIPCYFTIDAGPNVKVLCQANDVQRITSHLAHVHGVDHYIVSHIAGAPKITYNCKKTRLHCIIQDGSSIGVKSLPSTRLRDDK